MDELMIENRKFLSSKRAAEMTGYAQDYVGQLARMGKISARRVGRTWYVDESDLREYRLKESAISDVNTPNTEKGLRKEAPEEGKEDTEPTLPIEVAEEEEKELHHLTVVPGEDTDLKEISSETLTDKPISDYSEIRDESEEKVGQDEPIESEEVTTVDYALLPELQKPSFEGNRGSGGFNQKGSESSPLSSSVFLLPKLLLILILFIASFGTNTLVARIDTVDHVGASSRLAATPFPTLDAISAYLGSLKLPKI